MSRVAKRPAPEGAKAGPSGRDALLPQFVPPQLSQPVEKPPSGRQWVHEIKLDGFRMAARIEMVGFSCSPELASTGPTDIRAPSRRWPM
jgi:ATP-dependent DNA ligase